MKAAWMQCKAEIKRTVRNPYFVFWSLVMPIIFYVIFTKIVNTGVPNKALWQKHYLMSMTVFSVMGSAIMTLGIRLVQERTEGWSTVMRVAPLSSYSYFLAKMIAQTVIHLLSIIVIFSAGFLLNGVSLSLFEWVMSGLWILVGSIAFLSLGTLVGCMKKVDTVSGVSNVIYLVLAVLGGLWMPIEVLPNMMQTIGKWLPSYHFGNGAWLIIRGNPPEWKSMFVLLGYFFLFMLLSTYMRKKQEAV